MDVKHEDRQNATIASNSLAPVIQREYLATEPVIYVNEYRFSTQTQLINNMFIFNNAERSEAFFKDGNGTSAKTRE